MSGGSEFGFPDLPHTDDYLILGDFNMMPETPEYIAMAGRVDPYYAARRGRRRRWIRLAISARASRMTIPGKSPKSPKCGNISTISSRAPRLRRGSNAVEDMTCIASDHKPVWLEMA